MINRTTSRSSHAICCPAFNCAAYPDDALDVGGGPLQAERGSCLARFGLDGVHHWSIGPQGKLAIAGVVARADDSVVLAGTFRQETLDLGGGQLHLSPLTWSCESSKWDSTYGDIGPMQGGIWCSEIVNSDVFLVRLRPLH